MAKTNVEKISEREHKCLTLIVEAWESEQCPYMRHIVQETKLTMQQVRRSVRSLARKGFAQYTRGFLDDDGMVAGSGYCATDKGTQFIQSRIDLPE